MMALAIAQEFEGHLSSRMRTAYRAYFHLRSTPFILRNNGIARNSVNTRVPHRTVPYRTVPGTLALV